MYGLEEEVVFGFIKINPLSNMLTILQAEASKGQIWTSYAKTTRYWVLSKYDEQVPFANNKTPEEIDLGEQMLFGILEDQNENIWFGHLEGIGRYNGTSFDYFKAPDQLPNNQRFGKVSPRSMNC